MMKRKENSWMMMMKRGRVRMTLTVNDDWLFN
jgi:hypothetical protein